jgi:hypothetical protein
MGTRSRIGIERDGVILSVYCHWDGYVAHNGAILQEHYDAARTADLLCLGDMSVLGKELGEEHQFSRMEVPEDQREEYEALTENWCTFYGRDRGEKGTEFKTAKSFNQFLDQCEGCGAEYYYILKNDEWLVGDTYDCTPLSKQLMSLAQILADERKLKELAA